MIRYQCNSTEVLDASAKSWHNCSAEKADSKIVTNMKDIPTPNRAYSVELRQLRYFVAVGEEQHYGRAAQRLRVAQPALSRQIQNLEEEIGFKLFERLPRGVRITDAGKLFLEDARRLLQEINDASARAKRIASGQSGTLRIGFVESISWQGIVPDSLKDFREHHPDVELQLKSLRSLDQFPAIHVGALDAGFALPIANPTHGLAHLQIGVIKHLLAVPNEHPLTRQKSIRLRDLVDMSFIRFPRWAIPNAFDRLAAACARGGLKAPRIVQETAVETMILSLVQCSVGVAFVSSAARWRCPPGVTLLPVADLDVAFPFALMWRKDNNSPVLAKFTAHLKSLVARVGRKDEILG
jgi:DNA-binding transcriptional LysR family regulator